MVAASKSDKPSREEELAASKEAALAAYEKLLEARQHFRQAAEAAGLDMKDEALQQLERGRDKADERGEQASHFVREKPLATLGFAFLAGYIFALILGRR